MLTEILLSCTNKCSILQYGKSHIAHLTQKSAKLAGVMIVVYCQLFQSMLIPRCFGIATYGTLSLLALIGLEIISTCEIYNPHRFGSIVLAFLISMSSLGIHLFLATNAFRCFAIIAGTIAGEFAEGLKFSAFIAPFLGYNIFHEKVYSFSSASGYRKYRRGTTLLPHHYTTNPLQMPVKEVG